MPILYWLLQALQFVATNVLITSEIVVLGAHVCFGTQTMAVKVLPVLKKKSIVLFLFVFINSAVIQVVWSTFFLVYLTIATKVYDFLVGPSAATASATAKATAPPSIPNVSSSFQPVAANTAVSQFQSEKEQMNTYYQPFVQRFRSMDAVEANRNIADVLRRYRSLKPKDKEDEKEEEEEEENEHDMVEQEEEEAKRWEQRQLMEALQTGSKVGNMILYYDVKTRRFVYFCDQSQVSYQQLFYAAIKYCVVYRCRDFFADEEFYPDNPMYKTYWIPYDLDVNPPVKRSSSHHPPTASQNFPPTTTKTMTTTTPVQSPPKKYIKNMFVKVGKMSDYYMIPARWKKQETLVRAHNDRMNDAFCSLMEDDDGGNSRSTAMDPVHLFYSPTTSSSSRSPNATTTTTTTTTASRTKVPARKRTTAPINDSDEEALSSESEEDPVSESADSDDETPHPSPPTQQPSPPRRILSQSSISNVPAGKMSWAQYKEMQQQSATPPPPPLSTSSSDLALQSSFVLVSSQEN